MDDSRRIRGGWTWRTWAGVAIAIAVVAGLVVLIATSAGGSDGGGLGGLY